jgi:hypothetical protein
MSHSTNVTVYDGLKLIFNSTPIFLRARTTMPPTKFEFKKANAFTMVIEFPDEPNWQDLALKVESLYNVPFSDVGFSFIDEDDDLSTFFTDNVLQDFYTQYHRPPQTIELIVQDRRSPDIYCR